MCNSISFSKSHPLHACCADPPHTHTHTPTPTSPHPHIHNPRRVPHPGPGRATDVSNATSIQHIPPWSADPPVRRCSICNFRDTTATPLRRRRPIADPPWSFPGLVTAALLKRRESRVNSIPPPSSGRPPSRRSTTAATECAAPAASAAAAPKPTAVSHTTAQTRDRRPHVGGVVRT